MLSEKNALLSNDIVTITRDIASYIGADHQQVLVFVWILFIAVAVWVIERLLLAMANLHWSMYPPAPQPVIPPARKNTFATVICVFGFFRWTLNISATILFAICFMF